jgi:hypothetical protein
MMETLTFGKAALSCGMVMQVPACEGEKQEDHDCCDDEYQDVLKDDHFAKSQFDLLMQIPDFAQSGPLVVRPAYFVEKRIIISYPPYRPPPPGVKRFILLQTFLI